MTKKEKKRQYCSGCRDDYYNHGDNSTSGECWSLDGAKVVWSKEVPMNQRPPWHQKARRTLSCFRRSGHVEVSPHMTR